jgi:hypothetical protein
MLPAMPFFAAGFFEPLGVGVASLDEGADASFLVGLASAASDLAVDGSSLTFAASAGLDEAGSRLIACEVAGGGACERPLRSLFRA